MRAISNIIAIIGILAIGFMCFNISHELVHITQVGGFNNVNEVCFLGLDMANNKVSNSSITGWMQPSNASMNEDYNLNQGKYEWSAWIISLTIGVILIVALMCLYFKNLKR